MKHFSWILTLPLAIVVIVFSVNNVTDMPVDLWPFGIVAMWPTYLVVLLSVLFGFFYGAIVMWFSGHKSRHEARRRRAETQRLAHELDSLRKSSERPAPSAAAEPTRQLTAAGSD